MTPLQNLEGRVEAFLGQLGLAEAFRPGGVTAVDAGDTVVLVTCFEQDDATWVRLAALVLTEVEPTVGLLHHLLQLNHDVLLGSFQLFEDRTLTFSATLHGHDLDPDAFARTLRYVAWIGGTSVRALAERAGGRSWPDARPEAAPC
jgi:hypothetical protein